MSRYIDADKFIERLNASPAFPNMGTGGYFLLGVVEDLLKSFLTADVVEVVRCKECKHWGGITYGFVCRKFSGIDTKICMGADHYCSYGERSENGKS